MSSNPVAYAQKRRSSRIDKAIRLVVQGVGAFRAPYREEVTTLNISCHGCTYNMREEVLLGDLVFFDVGQRPEGRSESFNRARVKWIQKLPAAKDRVFQVAVELEIAGNIWGISLPPVDWFPVDEAKVNGRANSGHELRVVTRTEPQTATLTGGARPLSALKNNGPSGSLPPSFSESIVCLGEQIQIIASETIAAALAKEKSRMLEEIRVELRGEVRSTLKDVMAASEKELVRRAQKELNDAQDAAARTNYERWMKAVEQNMKGAQEHMTIRGQEVSQRIESTAISTIERVQRTLETSRSESVDRFVSRLRDQVAPLLEEAKTDLQKLAATESTLKAESQAIYTRFANQFEGGINEKMTEAFDQLDKHHAVVMNESGEKLLEISRDCERAAREHLQSLVVSAVNHTRKVLEERAAEISRHFSAQLEAHTRRYLESVSESIAEISKKTTIHSHG